MSLKLLDLAKLVKCLVHVPDGHSMFWLLEPLHSSLDSQNLRFHAPATTVTHTLQQLPPYRARVYKIPLLRARFGSLFE